MAHVFDTGIALAQRTKLRRSVLDLLAPLGRASGGYLHAIEPWGGVIRGYQDELGIGLMHEALVGRSPAVLVALGDRLPTDKHLGGFASRCSVELLVYFYSSSLRGDLEGRVEIDAVGLADNRADPGLDVMLEHVEELLVGQRPGTTPTIKNIVFRGEEEVRTEADFSLWLQRYTVAVDRAINPNRGITEMLTEFRTAVRTSDMPDDPGDPTVAEAHTTPTT